VLYDLAEQLRVAAVLLKPFLPQTAELLYGSFNFPQPWAEVRYEDAWDRPRQNDDLWLRAVLEGGNVKPLFPRIKDK
jgi:methionyl-tRNA synthetase